MPTLCARTTSYIYIQNGRRKGQLFIVPPCVPAQLATYIYRTEGERANYSWSSACVHAQLATKYIQNGRRKGQMFMVLSLCARTTSYIIYTMFMVLSLCARTTSYIIYTMFMVLSLCARTSSYIIYIQNGRPKDQMFMVLSLYGCTTSYMIYTERQAKEPTVHCTQLVCMHN